MYYDQTTTGFAPKGSLTFKKASSMDYAFKVV